MAKILSGKVKKIPPTEVSAGRYDFIQLSETEPDLGTPSTNGYVLTSDTAGNRSWVEPASPTITFTTSSTAEVVVENIDSTLYRSVKYEMQLTSALFNQVSELRLLIDNENAFLTEYGTIGDALGNFASYYSPLNNDYSAPDINNGGLSYWNSYTLYVYTADSVVQQSLLSLIATNVIRINDTTNITLSTKFIESSPGLYQASTVGTPGSLTLISRIAWTGTGNVELRFTPVNSATTIKYIRTFLSV